MPILAVLAEKSACRTYAAISPSFVGERGEPLTKESFGNIFKDACKAAGVSGSAHGVRKIAATAAANNGATEAS